eukprot:CAMPEP_0198595682 /NCGR_PEP_ID=MMETSP1462-20131121/142177_1 /TAXON_ID=1333877 /ORGANISM="Brandtodinium nutriculum, Strain RCC3387" /LENGTH=147 /DNA_ID=CAMNT_0044327321 /DNA_START=27 /DNA_END=465 /DNA_ORIENTATION=-
MTEFRAAWQSYWEFSSHLWRAVLRAFRGYSRVTELQNECVRAATHEGMRRQLENLRCAAKKLGDASAAASSAVPGLDCVALVLEVIIAMVSDGDFVSVPSWVQIHCRLRAAIDNHGTPAMRKDTVANAGTRAARAGATHAWTAKAGV